MIPIASLAIGDEPVPLAIHAEIDRLIAASAQGPLAGLADDLAFHRRAWLDLAGHIPNPQTSRAFLADTGPDKRQRLIDLLLASPDYPRRMRDAFHVMLMERSGDHPEWTRFLQFSFEANKPWDQLAREILCPNPLDENTRGSAFFFTKRLEAYGQNPVDLPGLARDVGRLFLGVDLQCAQCHDHLQIEDYKQDHFQGLFAFVGHTFIRGDQPFPSVGENPLKKKIDFMSVFDQQPKSTGPRLPGGAEFEIPAFPEGEEFEQPGIPKFSTLRLLADHLPSQDTATFAANIVNRVWFLMMGTGLVQPLDLIHRGNPPSHPELLDLLAGQFVAHGYDIKWLMRELALTETYQRSSLLPEGEAPTATATYCVFREKPLSAEQLAACLLQATGDLERLAAAEAAQAPPAEPMQTELAMWRDRFAKAFANPPREPEIDFVPTVKAVLFLMNDSQLLSLVQRRPGNLLDRLVVMAECQMDNHAQLADELYLSVLARLPDDDERATVHEHLAASAAGVERPLAQLLWSLIASTEFRLNH